MLRRRQTGKKRYANRKYRLRYLIPRIGFDLRDKKCRAMLSGIDSGIVKHHIRASAGNLTKMIVDEALAAIFTAAIATMEQDPDKIAEMIPGEYWGVIRDTIPWATDTLAGHTIFSLVATLVLSHEKYDAVSPYNKFKHQYGKLAEAVHKFSQLLKQHHQGNPLIMAFYFSSSISLPSDDEDDSENEEAETPAVDEEGDLKMVDYHDEENKEEKEEQELREGVKAIDLKQTSSPTYINTLHLYKS
ncbi:hypothetical protein GGR54DRAFT_635693 [Hypoxylon sp. NC1633]|nr:hypothetical protein GGR54DRAFT_635693 [Hypoxylon sp. NC1633]